MRLLVTAGIFAATGGLVALILMMGMARNVAPDWTPYVWPTCVWLGAIAADPTGHAFPSIITRVLAVLGNAGLYGVVGTVVHLVVTGLRSIF
jgi:hypothetical protein